MNRRPTSPPAQQSPEASVQDEVLLPLPTPAPTPCRILGESLASLVGASLTVVGDSVYVFGGFDRFTDEVFKSLYRLERHAGQSRWTRIIYTKGAAPSELSGHSVTLWNDTKLVVFGGSSEEDNTFFNQIAILDLSTMVWSHPTTTGHIPEGRVNHSATIYQNKLYIAGGNTANPSSFADTLLILDLETLEWQPPVSFVKRQQHATFIYDHRLYLYGGFREDMGRSNHLSFINLDTYAITHLDFESASAPPLTGQRFGQICGDQLVVVVVTAPSTAATVRATRETHQPQIHATGVWTLDLTSMQWQQREMGSRYGVCNWHCFAMGENDTAFYLFGTEEDEPYDYYAMALRVDLQELGIVVVPPPQLGHDLVNLLASHTGDFSISSSLNDEKGEVRVHRLVLMARWPHFAALLQSGMEETVQSTLMMPYGLESLQALVIYLYSDSIDQIRQRGVIADLLVMAQVYELPRLSTLCIRRLHHPMTIDSVSKVYHCAGLAGQPGLQHSALAYMFQHFGAVSHTHAFRSLPREVLFQIWDAMPDNATIVGYTSRSPSVEQDAGRQSDSEMSGVDS
ncbi:hypothetical protein F4703DRAFT_1726993 [Phycomyces blakesleeanus]